MKSVKGYSPVKLVLFVCMLLAMTGCADLRSLRVTGWQPLSVSPKGLSSLDAKVRLDIMNPGAAINLSDITATVRQDGREIAMVTAEPVRIEAKCTAPCYVDGTVRILDGLSLFDIKNLLGSADFSTYYLDISARVGSGNSKGQMMRFNGIPLSQLIDK